MRRRRWKTIMIMGLWPWARGSLQSRTSMHDTPTQSRGIEGLTTCQYQHPVVTRCQTSTAYGLYSSYVYSIVVCVSASNWNRGSVIHVCTLRWSGNSGGRETFIRSTMWRGFRCYVTDKRWRHSANRLPLSGREISAADAASARAPYPADETRNYVRRGFSLSLLR